MKKTTFKIDRQQFDQLHRHLFPGDHDEHGAVILSGIAETETEVTFIAREVLIARDKDDFVPGKHGYRALSADFVARASHRAATQKLCYFSVHNHGGFDSVSFSDTDLESHERGYPALLDILGGGPLGALVFAKNAVAGEIWTREGITQLDAMTIVGLNAETIYPELPKVSCNGPSLYHRQSLLFGSAGQDRLAKAKVVIIGLGGVGSLVNEYVARLGVGTIVAIDFDQLEDTNVPRVVGSKLWESFTWLRTSRFPLLRKLGDRLARHKVEIAKRVAKQANANVNFIPIRGNIRDQSVAAHCTDADFIFLCADSMQSRLIFNAILHQYVIPGVQIGSKVPIDKTTGAVGNVFAVSRLVLPETNGGCLLCNDLISFDRIQEEALSEEERRRQAYVEDPDVKAPSVITLNALGAAHAVNQFLFHFFGMFESSTKRGYRMNFVREDAWQNVACKSEPNCPHCSKTDKSIYGHGDRKALPCKVDV